MQGSGKWKANAVFALALATGAIFPAMAEEASAATEAFDYPHRVAEALRHEDGLREQLLARLLQSGSDASVVADDGLLARVDASDDPIALVLAVQVGIRSKDIELRDVAASRWQALEPDNLAPLAFVDEAGEMMLSRAEEARRFEMHYYDLIRYLTGVFRAHPQSEREMQAGREQGYSAESMASIMAFAVSAAYALPSLTPLTRSCRDEALQVDDRRQHCLDAAQTLVDHSDTLIGRSIGISMLEQAGDAPELARQAKRLRRQYAWEIENLYGRATDLTDAQDIAEVVQLIDKPGIDSEMALIAERLRLRGVSPTPPEDWQPETPPN
ncbi:hypothetical protein [Pseudoxanthomonas kalamensis]|uniref:hypothetical protein n=1 Tax=Pseudoxanthomonas kalamensis TaxID=289483 RepID=UPI0013916745|nr:hypothetical protein [Pseudoxanthomonas kalamensis]